MAAEQVNLLIDCLIADAGPLVLVTVSDRCSHAGRHLNFLTTAAGDPIHLKYRSGFGLGSDTFKIQIWIQTWVQYI